MQYLSDDQLHLIKKGKMHQTILRNQINEALFNNPFNDNYIISSPPGLGKSYETEQAVATMPESQRPLFFQGDSGIFALIIDIITAAYYAKGNPVNAVLDDCDVLFDSKNVNTTKKMFDQARTLNYGKNWRNLKGQATEEQLEALEYFASNSRVGLQVPVDNFTFLVLTNRYLPTINDVESIDQGSKKYRDAVDLHAIRRRTECKPIDIANDELWGYVTNVIINEKICEKFYPDICEEKKYQIVNWMDKNWHRVTERNLSLVEKLAKDMVRYSDIYLDVWNNNYLES